MKMRTEEAVEIIRRYKDDPLTDPEKDTEYNDAINTILDTIENGANIIEWIPCTERLPEKNGNYLVTVEANDGTASLKFQMVDHYGPKWLHEGKREKVIAWMPLPEPYKGSSEEEEQNDND